MKQDDPDAELIERVGRRDPGAIRQLVGKKLPKLLALAARMLGDRHEANDVAQEVFIRIWKHAAQWRPGAAQFDTWVHRVTLNLCYDRLRQMGKLSDDEAAEAIDPAPRPDQRLEQRDLKAEVAAALAGLPNRQREAIVLQYYEQLSNGATAELMGISVEALESLLSRARRNLRGKLAGVASIHDKEDV